MDFGNTTGGNKRYADRIARGSALIFVTNFVALFVAYLLRLFLTRALTVEEYGLLYAVVTFVNFFALFRDLGFNQALVKFVPEWLVKKQSGKVGGAIAWVIKFQALFSGFTAIVIFFLAPWLANVYFHSAGSTPMTQIMAISFFAAAFGATFYASLQGLQRITAYAILVPVNSLLTLIFTAVLLFAGFGLIGVVSAYILTAFAFGAITGIVLLKRLPHGDSALDGGDKSQMTKFALPVLLGFVGGMILGATDTIVLTFFRSLSEVGLYQAALPTSQILWVVGSAIAIVLFPLVSELWAGGNKRVLSNGMSIILRFAFMLVLPFALMMLVWPEFVLSLLFGESYVAGAVALQILALSAIVYTLWQICATVLSGIGRPDLTTKIMLSAAVFNLVLNIALVQFFGMVGVAFTTLVSFAIAFGAAYVFLKKTISLEFGLAAIIKSIISGLVMTGLIVVIKIVLNLNPWFEVAISIIAGIVVYAILLLRLKAVNKSDLEMLSKLAIPIPKFVFKLARALIVE